MNNNNKCSRFLFSRRYFALNLFSLESFLYKNLISEMNAEFYIANNLIAYDCYGFCVTVYFAKI